MTTGPNRILDEFAKLVTDAAGAAQSVRKEAETVMRSQAERLLSSMDLVQREEFEAMRDVALKARVEVRELAARVEALEARLAAQAGAPEPAKAPRRPASRAKDIK